MPLRDPLAVLLPHNRDREGPRGLPPSHTTVRTGHVYGGSVDSVRVIHPTRVSSPGVPAASSYQMLGIARHLAGGHLATPRQATTPLYRSGLQHATACLRCPLLTPAWRSGRIPPPAVLCQNTPQISRGQLSYPLCIDAGFITYAPAVDRVLCGGVPTRPERPTPHIRFVSLAPHLRSTLPADPTSR
jgi:hypothetical protein